MFNVLFGSKNIVKEKKIVSEKLNNKKFLTVPLIMAVMIVFDLIKIFRRDIQEWDITQISIKYFIISNVILIIYVSFCIYRGIKNQKDGVNGIINKNLAIIALIMFIISAIMVNYIRYQEEKASIDLKMEMDQYDETKSKGKSRAKSELEYLFNRVEEYNLESEKDEYFENKVEYYKAKKYIINEMENKTFFQRYLNVNLIFTPNHLNNINYDVAIRNTYYGSLNLFMKVYFIFFLFYFFVKSKIDKTEKDVFYDM